MIPDIQDRIVLTNIWNYWSMKLVVKSQTNSHQHRMLLMGIFKCPRIPLCNIFNIFVVVKYICIVFKP